MRYILEAESTPCVANLVKGIGRWIGRGRGNALVLAAQGTC